jgi:hypothetical protein
LAQSLARDDGLSEGDAPVVGWNLRVQEDLEPGSI